MILKIDAYWDVIPSRMIEILRGLKRLFVAITRARNGGIRFLWNVRVCLPEHMADTFERVANLRFLQTDALRKGDDIREIASESCQF